LQAKVLGYVYTVVYKSQSFLIPQIFISDPITMTSFSFAFVSGLFIVISIQKNYGGFINLDPFLAHTENCYTNLIIYDPKLNIVTKTLPVTISTPDFSYSFYDKSCRPHRGNFGTLNDTKEGLCDLVRHNFHSYRITCVAITLVDSWEIRDIKDAYWYLINYWSNLVWIDRNIIIPRNTKSEKWWQLSENQEEAFHMELFPSKVFVHVLAKVELSLWGT